MKFKVDENLPIELADLLCEAGHDAVTVHDEKLGGADDDDIAPVCQREARAFLTFDLGFSDIRSYPPFELPRSDRLSTQVSRQTACSQGMQAPLGDHEDRGRRALPLDCRGESRSDPANRERGILSVAGRITSRWSGRGPSLRSAMELL
jgi:hypothetical protein